MRKLLAALMIAATFSLGFAQDNTQRPERTTEQMLKLGHAPSQPEGVGRAVVVVKDNEGNPIKGAYVHLESRWGDGELCESWDWTNEDGVVALPPLHMGILKMLVEAKGFQKSKIMVSASSLGDPVQITILKK